MILNISFLDNIKENLKRRKWVMVVNALIFFIVFPLATIIIMNNENPKKELNIEAARSVFTNVFTSFGYMGIFISSIVIIVAIISAFSAYSYLYNKKQVDFYLSVPIPKWRSYLVRQVNGFLIFIVFYLINIIATLLIGISYQAVTYDTLIEIIQIFGMHILLFACIYEITSICIFLTGHLIVGMLAFFVLSSFEIVAKTIWYSLHYIFYDSFIEYSINTVIFSNPLYPLLSWFTNKDLGVYNDTIFKSFDEVESIAALIILFVVTVFISYILYAIRPNEAAEKAMAFEKSKIIIKAFIMILTSFGTGEIFYYITNENRFFMVFGIIFGMILAHGFIEVIYEFDISGIVHNKRSFIYIFPVIVVMFLVFALDLTNYDEYLPKQENIKSMSFYSRESSGRYFTDKFNSEEVINNMNIDNVENIYKLAKICVDNKNDGNVVYCIFKFNLKNGKTIYRNYYLQKEEEEKIFEKIFEQKEYKEYLKKNLFELKDQVERYYSKELNFEKVAFSYYNGILDEEISMSNKDEIIKAYKKDIENAKHKEIKNDIPIGRLDLYCFEDETKINEKWRFNKNNMREIENYNVYPSFENTINLLNELGVYKEFTLKTEEIESITLKMPTDVFINKVGIEEKIKEKDIIKQIEETTNYFEYNNKIEYLTESRIKEVEKLIKYIENINDEDGIETIFSLSGQKGELDYGEVNIKISKKETIKNVLENINTKIFADYYFDKRDSKGAYQIEIFIKPNEKMPKELKRAIINRQRFVYFGQNLDLY